MSEEQVVKKKGDILKDFVMTDYHKAVRHWQPIHDDWKKMRSQYNGIYLVGKELWQGNIIIPTLKKVVRALCSHYINILLSKGAESFDIAPGEESDKKNAELLRYKMIYDLNTLEIEKKILPILKNFVLYGYAVAYVPWKHTVEKQRVSEEKIKEVVTFNGPDLVCVDLFKFFSDPNCLDLTSWKIYEKDNVPIHYLKSKEKTKKRPDGIFSNVDAIKMTTYPETMKDDLEYKDKVELLEYHGLVPKKLIEGKINDLTEPNPFDDEYIPAIIVVANQEVVIRATPYPYWCNDIFVPFVNDHMVDEIIGNGVGQDIKALAPMLTNLYNKLTDCVNIVANPMYEAVINRYLGKAKTILTRPGRVLPVRQLGGIRAIDTTAQAASLRTIQELIVMIDKIIDELTGTTPQVMPASGEGDVHRTMGGLAMMKEESMLPINTKIKFYLEPPFRKVLGIIYRHNIQRFKKEDWIRILGEKAKDFDLEQITKEDIMMKGNPDFVPTGISGFMERMAEIRNLLDYMKLLAGIAIPATKLDQTGQEVPIFDPEGKPAMKPYGNIAYIARRIAELLRLKEIDKIAPEVEELEKPKQIEAPKGSPRQNSPAGAASAVTPQTLPGGQLGRAAAGVTRGGG